MRFVIVTICLCIFVGSGIAAPEITRTLTAPSGDISGLAWGDGMLWCLDSGTSWCYGLDPVSGEVKVSFHFAGYSSYTPAGLAYNGTYLFASFVNGGSSPYVYWYTTSGTYVYYDLIC